MTSQECWASISNLRLTCRPKAQFDLIVARSAIRSMPSATFFSTSGTRVSARGGFGGNLILTGLGGLGGRDGPKIFANSMAIRVATPTRSGAIFAALAVLRTARRSIALKALTNANPMAGQRG